PLQGVWTADQGTLPPWHGDYHHDLNTQLTYWAYLTSGRFDQGAAFVDFMWDLLPLHRKFAQKFYGTTGAAVPGVMTLDGKPMGGWSQYSLSPTDGAWVAQAFYLHWRYTMDDEFLAQRAYPYCRAIAECLRDLLEPDADGKLKLPLSTSPEIHNNSLASWLTPNSTNDLSLLRWLFGALVEMAQALGDQPAAAEWQDVLDGLDELAVEGEAGPLRLAPDESLAESHRHHSHLMPIHPLGLLDVEGTDRDRRIIDASLAEIDRLGTPAWCGYSFSWMSCISARAAKPDRAVKNLEIFIEAFISRNGFHVNGDYKRLGYSNFSYRPFTLEGNFAAGQAVHEMLLGSWGGTVRIFPAVPDKWPDVSFQNLRAEGGYIISARREGGSTTEVRIQATHDGLLKLRDPLPGKPVSWNRPDVKKVGADYQSTLAAGEVLEGRL
ncbi:MAG: glycoside hydrolase family 95-like protein, partial [Planctomycetota bacterium]